ncbi:hypothetical protein KJ608_02260 [Patescibacteria group bacterium]|nr:hypothetical protein [Patescibacteria group bacterium]
MPSISAKAPSKARKLRTILVSYLIFNIFLFLSYDVLLRYMIKYGKEGCQPKKIIKDLSEKIL